MTSTPLVEENNISQELEVPDIQDMKTIRIHFNSALNSTRIGLPISANYALVHVSKCDGARKTRSFFVISIDFEICTRHNRGPCNDAHVFLCQNGRAALVKASAAESSPPQL